MADGRGVQPQDVTRSFPAACRDGGFPVIRLDDLRHTSVARSGSRRALVEVPERLGHKQPAITADRYTHVLPALALASSQKRQP